ncbi:helix-turn-helix domain-containing protein [Streptomyces mayteni]
MIRGEDFEARERFDAWCEVTSRMPCRHRIRTDHPDDYRFTLRMAALGVVSIAQTAVPSLHATRTPRLIRQCTSDLYQLELCTGGRVGAEQSGREVVATSGQWILHDSARPYSLWNLADGQPVQSAMALQVPKHLLGINRDAVAPLLTRPLPGTVGFGRLLSDLLARVLHEPQHFLPADAPRLGDMARDLVSALLAHELDADRLLPEPTHHQALQLRIRAYVLDHLGDPDLTPGRIAAAHHISVRYLHRLFRPDGQSPAAWIREQRLRRACRDLAAPGQRHTPVYVIGARWGFTSAADFSRTFRRAYGMPPTDYRKANER